MRPEPSLSERSRAALELWRGLRAAYDAIESALEAPDAHDLGLLAARIVALEGELQPLIADLAAARSRTRDVEPAVEEIWCQIDALVATLATQQPQLVRAALAARTTTAQRLDGLRVARGQLRRYDPDQPATARLTSRSA